MKKVINLEQLRQAVLESKRLTGEVAQAAARAIGELAAAMQGGVPSGCILIWSGAEEELPEGWALCDGQDGRPDLRSRFVLGAGSGYAVSVTGGEESHILTMSELPRHNHTNSDHYLNFKTGSNGASAGDTTVVVSGTHQYSNKAVGYTGEDAAHNNMPPYYALCYIIKL